MSTQQVIRQQHASSAAATLAQVRVRRIPAAADTRWFGPAEVQFGSQSSPALLRAAEPSDREQRAREQSPEYRLWRAIFVAIYDDVRAEGPNGPTMLEVGQAELLRELEEVAGCMGYADGSVARLLAEACESWRGRSAGARRVAEARVRRLARERD